MIGIKTIMNDTFMHVKEIVVLLMTSKYFGLNMQILSHTVQVNGKFEFLKKIAISNEHLSSSVGPILHRIIGVDPQTLSCSK